MPHGHLSGAKQAGCMPGGHSLRANFLELRYGEVRQVWLSLGPVLDRCRLAASFIGYKAHHQASEARRSAKQPFAPTIGFAGLCRWLPRRCAPVQYLLIRPGLCGTSENYPSTHSGE
jgi:hypothetical protein